MWSIDGYVTLLFPIAFCDVGAVVMLCFGCFWVVFGLFLGFGC